jgi:hypothetical protein
MNYGGQALSATMMFGPEVFIPATIAATALGFALGKQAEDERSLRAEIDKNHSTMEAFRSTLGPTGDAVSTLGLHVKTLQDLKFTSPIASTDKFTEKVNNLSEAFANGSDQSKALIAELKDLPKAQRDAALQTQGAGVLMGGGTKEDYLATMAHNL